MRRYISKTENKAGEGTITSALALFNSDQMKKMKK